MVQDVSNRTFHKISPGIYLYPPQISSSSPSNTDTPAPELILLFGWFGANLRAIYKYISVYEKLYPNATKLVIGCQTSFYWSWQSSRHAYLAPVVEVLEGLGCIPSSPTKGSSPQPSRHTRQRILIHALSNGGAGQLVTLSQILTARFPNWNIFEPSTSILVFDSCPGALSLQLAKRLMRTLFRNNLMFWFAISMVVSVYSYDAVKRRVSGALSTLEANKLALNNPRLLPWVDAATPRLYLYSKKDELVLSQDVEEHIRDVTAAGFPVRYETFEDTPHVRHAKNHPERYWAAVKATWEKACEQEMGKSVPYQPKYIAKLCEAYLLMSRALVMNIHHSSRHETEME